MLIAGRSPRTLAIAGTLITLLLLRTATSTTMASSDNWHSDPKPRTPLGELARKLAPVWIASHPWTFASLFLLSFGVAFLPIGIINLHTEHVYRTEGKVVTGVVLTKSSREEHHYNPSSRVDTRVVRYQLGYRFNTPTGQTFNGSEEVDWRTWSSVSERDPIRIVYLPRHPSSSRLAADRSVLMDWLLPVLGALVSSAGLGLLVYGTRYAPRRSVRPRPLKLVSVRQLGVARKGSGRRH